MPNILTKRVFLWFITPIFMLLIGPIPVFSQQMIVDDATLSAHQSTHFEGWYGTEESSFQAIIAAGSHLDIGPGLLASSANRFEVNRWYLEVKTVMGNLTDNGQAAGIVAAAVFDMTGPLSGYYVYVPYSFSYGDRKSTIHLNAGLEGVKIDYWSTVITTGIRYDFRISERALLLSEMFSFGLKNTSYHAGIQIKAIPGILVSEITYGSRIRNKNSYPGFNIGLVFTPHNF